MAAGREGGSSTTDGLCILQPTKGGIRGDLRRVVGLEGGGQEGTGWGIEGIWLTMPLSEEMMVTDYDPNLNTHIHLLDENQDNNLHEGMTEKT